MPESIDSDQPDSQENEGLREQLIEQLQMIGAIAAMTAQKGAVQTARLAMPLMRGYLGCEHDAQFDDDTSDPDSKNQLSPREKATVVDAAAKVTYEAIELATLAYPMFDGIEPYRAVKNDNGCYPAPHLGHLMSLGKAVKVMGEKFTPDQQDTETEVNSQAKPVLLTSLSSNEYGYLNSPLDPKTIRRIALNERELMLTEQGSQASQPRNQQ